MRRCNSCTGFSRPAPQIFLARTRGGISAPARKSQVSGEALDLISFPTPESGCCDPASSSAVLGEAGGMKDATGQGTTTPQGGENESQSWNTDCGGGAARRNCAGSRGFRGARRQWWRPRAVRTDTAAVPAAESELSAEWSEAARRFLRERRVPSSGETERSMPGAPGRPGDPACDEVVRENREWEPGGRPGSSSWFFCWR